MDAHISVDITRKHYLNLSERPNVERETLESKFCSTARLMNKQLENLIVYSTGVENMYMINLNDLGITTYVNKPGYETYTYKNKELFTLGPISFVDKQEGDSYICEISREVIKQI